MVTAPAVPARGDQTRSSMVASAFMDQVLSSTSRTTGTRRRRSSARKQKRRTAGRGVQNQRYTTSSWP